MSKWMKETENGQYEETIADADGCKYMYNEVCCNDQSEWCCSYPGEYCKACKLFEPEDMA
nr:MAG TPA: hypothetical protein [Caudoviricetes sp.]